MNFLVARRLLKRWYGRKNILDVFIYLLLLFISLLKDIIMKKDVLATLSYAFIHVGKKQTETTIIFSFLAK